MKFYATIIVTFLIALSISGAPTVRVKHVSDGDSFILSNGERVRMIGINAPELADKFGREAKQHLENLIEGKSVVLEADPQNDDRDKYGRLLRYVMLDSVDINRQMIVDGWAYAFLRYQFAAERRNAYRDAESTAKAARIGIWAAEAPPEERSASPILLIAAGAMVMAILFLAGRAMRRRRG